MHTYIIAEIGQNHNGDMHLAKKLIDIASVPIIDLYTGDYLPGVDAVKFTKRDLTEEMTKEEGERPYISPHSFGKTYMEHRQALELTNEQHSELEKYAHEKGLDFIETLCSPGCIEMLNEVKVNAIKIASRDITNIPLLQKLSERSEKIILSTGMCTLEELEYAIGILSKCSGQISILHCLSEYPSNYSNINLRSITFLKKRFPDYEIGYSDHSIGIVMPVVAVSMGASIIEKHITLNRNMKGSDHFGSVEPDGLWRIVRDIRNTEIALGTEKKEFSPCVEKTREKLSRSLALKISLKKGEILREDMLCMRSPGTGFKWQDKDKLIGKKIKTDLEANSLLRKEDFEA